ncbi:uncharacterized protein LOC143349570 [Colletes latitarsis]|uniref:uncharacterized protein LOC143349570 n=1 Tax=Colletes latitarsis TaxID=2605962 RepID=UPI004036F350
MQLSLSKKDWDGVIESQPHLITAAVGIVKLLSLHLNRQNFKEIFVSVKEEWEELKLTDELHYLEVLTERGSKIAQLYRSVLLSFLVVFVSLPLLNPLLDITVPLNESRRRIQILKLYYFVNNDEYFYSIYLHGTIGAISVILTIVSADSLYMVIVHHASGLFAVCGYMSQWYQAPLEVQRLLCTMQIRCSKPCSLTAGGLYEMNIENFGMTFKTCMSYFTMLLSMKQ